MMERVRGQVVDRQFRCLVVDLGQAVFVFVIGGAVLFQKFGRAVPSVVGMRKTEIDQKRIGVFGLLTLVQIVQHLLAVPGAARFVGTSSLGGIVAHRE